MAGREVGTSWWVGYDAEMLDAGRTKYGVSSLVSCALLRFSLLLSLARRTEGQRGGARTPTAGRSEWQGRGLPYRYLK